MQKQSKLWLLVAAGIIVPIAPAVAQRQSKSVQQLLAMAPADFERTAVLKDDALDTLAQISTEPGFQEKRGLLKMIWHDNFVRAFIDKKTGATTFQVYQYISYSGSWRFYTTANYETPMGPDSKPVTVIARNVNSCSAYVGCSFTEHVGFEVSEEMLRAIGARYALQPGSIWRFKFASKSGGDWQDGMATAEVAGILASVDRYRAARGLRQVAAIPANSIAPTEEPIAIAAAPKQPSTPAPPPKLQKKRSPITCLTCN